MRILISILPQDFDQVTVQKEWKSVVSLWPLVHKLYAGEGLSAIGPLIGAIRTAAPSLSSEAFPDLTKLWTLFAALQQADSVEGAEQIIASSVDETTYLTKNMRNFSVSPNAFVGLLGGGDWPPGLNPVTGVFSPWLPIGVSLNFNNGFSVNFAVLDLGQILQLDFTNPSSPSSVPLNPYNLIAPGVSLTWRILDSPFAVGISAQMDPRLRSWLAEKDAPYGGPGLKFGPTASIDVPFYFFP